MSITEALIQAALAAPEDRKVVALKILQGDPSTGSGQGRPETEPFLTLKECARRLGVSACSLWRWCVPGHELGGRRKFRISEVEAYLESDAFRRRAAELREEEKLKREAAGGRRVPVVRRQ